MSSDKAKKEPLELSEFFNSMTSLQGLRSTAKRFIDKPLSQKLESLQVFLWYAPAKLPFLPTRRTLLLSENYCLKYWWYHTYAQPVSESDIGVLRFLYHFLQSGDTFLDVGAYHGIYSLIAAKKIGGKGKVIAFEPSLREQNRLEMNIQLNRLFNIKVEPYAASSSIEKTTFFLVINGYETMNSLKNPCHGENTTQAVTVNTITLDEYIRQNHLTEIACLKIDVEGGEIEAFKSAERTLTEIRPLIICEVLEWVTQTWGYPAKDIIHYLEKHNYQWFDFHADGSLSPHQVIDQYSEIQNFLAVPLEKLSLMQKFVKLSG